MDETVAAILFVLAFVGFCVGAPFLLVISISSCIACSRTRQWKKEKLQRSNPNNLNVEAEALIEDSGDDLDPEDSDDEAAIKAREEKEQDWNLTPKQKFRKEFTRAWKGDGKDAAKVREREERRKLAKSVAKELARMERRRQRTATKASDSTSTEHEGLPTYNTAVANDQKR